MEVLSLIALIALLFMVGGLRGRVSALDATLRSLDDRLADLTRRTGLAAPAPALETAAAPAPAVTQPEPQRAPNRNRCCAICGRSRSSLCLPLPSRRTPRKTSPPRSPCSRRRSAPRHSTSRRHRRPPRPAARLWRFRAPLRHPMGGLDRRTGACARRHFSGALLDRSRPVRPGLRVIFGAMLRAVSRGPGRTRAPPRSHQRHRADQGRGYSEHSHGRRHHRGLCRYLGGLRAVRIPLARHRLCPSRTGGARNARGRTRAWTGTGRPGTDRRLRHAGAGGFDASELLGALRLSGGRDRCRLCAGPRAVVALARHHRGCVLVALDAGRHRPADGNRPDRAVRHRRICIGLDVPRRRLPVRTTGRARALRHGLLVDPCGLPVRHLPAPVRQQA